MVPPVYRQVNPHPFRFADCRLRVPIDSGQFRGKYKSCNTSCCRWNIPFSLHLNQFREKPGRCIAVSFYRQIQPHIGFWIWMGCVTDWVIKRRWTANCRLLWGVVVQWLLAHCNSFLISSETSCFPSPDI